MWCERETEGQIVVCERETYCGVREREGHILVCERKTYCDMRYRE